MARGASRAPGVLRALRGLAGGVERGLKTRQDISIQNREIAVREALNAIYQQREDTFTKREAREQKEFDTARASIPEQDEQARIKELSDIISDFLPVSFLNKLSSKDRGELLMLRLGLDGARTFGEAMSEFDKIHQKIRTIEAPAEEDNTEIDRLDLEFKKIRNEIQKINLEEKRSGKEGPTEEETDQLDLEFKRVRNKIQKLTLEEKRSGKGGPTEKGPGLPRAATSGILQNQREILFGFPKKRGSMFSRERDEPAFTPQEYFNASTSVLSQHSEGRGGTDRDSYIRMLITNPNEQALVYTDDAEYQALRKSVDVLSVDEKNELFRNVAKRIDENVRNGMANTLESLKMIVFEELKDLL